MKWKVYLDGQAYNINLDGRHYNVYSPPPSVLGTAEVQLDDWLYWLYPQTINASTYGYDGLTECTLRTNWRSSMAYGEYSGLSTGPSAFMDTVSFWLEPDPALFEVFADENSLSEYLSYGRGKVNIVSISDYNQQQLILNLASVWNPESMDSEFLEELEGVLSPVQPDRYNLILKFELADPTTTFEYQYYYFGYAGGILEFLCKEYGGDVGGGLSCNIEDVSMGIPPELDPGYGTIYLDVTALSSEAY